MKAYLLLEDGLFIEGLSIGKPGTTSGEICFNTGMTGYQEIYTDPSYYGQIIVNTNSHIGNYGVSKIEEQSSGPKLKALVTNSYSEVFSRANAEESLQDYLVRWGITGIADIDTRSLVRHIRDKGAMNAVISSEISDVAELKSILDNVPSMNGLELSSDVTTSAPYFYGNENAAYKVAVLDLGVKINILECLAARDCYLKVFPAKTSIEELEAWNPDGYFISNGPGDPAAMEYAVNTVKAILEKESPLFGICLGHQILARACGVSTYKMHNGHRGLNHPVMNLITGKGEITSQNHGFVANRKEVEAHGELIMTHVNLNDDTCAGLRVKSKPAFSVQYHPESAPGPHDSRYLFDEFVALMKN